VEGRNVPSYVEEQGILPDSRTPTFAALSVHIDNWRWQGVPFYLTSGKRLARKRTEIVVDFREVPHALFRNILDRGVRFNRLVLGIQPDEKITLTFQTKMPGQGVELRPVTMDFNYRQGVTDPAIDAYEKVLLDVLEGDQTLFWRQDALELTWAS
jgi:glucose-6-phosphate 1-dehydrogenase